MNKKYYLIVLLALIGIGGSAWYCHAYKYKPQTSALPSFTKASPFRHSLVVDGIVEPLGGIRELVPSREAILEKIYVREGDEVKENAPLYKMSTSSLENELRVLEAQKLSAQANYKLLKEEPRATDVAPLQENLAIQKVRLERLEQELKRSQSLVQQQAVSVASNDEVRTQTMVQRHSVMEAQRKLEQMQAGVSRYRLEQAQADILTIEKKILMTTKQILSSTVRAPFDGVVMSINRREGNYVSQHSLQITDESSAPVLFGRKELQINVLINEQDIGKIRPGMVGAACRMRGDKEFLPLKFAYIVPRVTPKKQFTGIATERLDVRVLHVVFVFQKTPANYYPGEQLLVYLDLDSGNPADPAKQPH